MRIRSAVARRALAHSLAVLAIAATTSGAFGQIVSWTGLGDGTSFGDQQNWDLLQVPGEADVAKLDGGGGAISFALDQQTGGLDVQADVWTFTLGGRTYTVVTDVTVGDLAGAASEMTLLGGTLHILEPGGVNDLVVGDDPGDEGVLVIGAGAAIRNDGETLVGDDGTGLLWVRDGGSLSTMAIVKIGNDVGGVGTLRVDGAGTTWEASRTVTVGNAADGTLEIQGGATASTTGSVFIGDDIGSSGEVTVDGAGTGWTCSGSLIVGNGDGGSLSVQAGANLTTQEIAKVGDNAGAIGSATISGNGSVWTAEQLLRVGANGAGSLTISAGATLSSHLTELARQPGSSAEVSVAGVGTTWNEPLELAVGVRGPATVTIDAGATLQAPTARLGVEADGDGEIVVAGGASWSNAVEVSVGLLGAGALTVQGGGAVTTVDPARGTLVAGQPGSVSSITVSGTGSQLNTAGPLEIGAMGDGAMNVGAGGAVHSPVAFIARDSGSTGTATVDGLDASWAVTGNLFVGNMGTGALEVRGGGEVVCGGLCRVGDEMRGDGAVLVTGTGSIMTCDTQLFVGNFGPGTLDVTGGGALVTTRAKVADEVGSTGTATVSGAGSTWSTANDLVVGNFGAGLLTISEGASVDSTDMTLGDESASNGQATIDDASISCTGTLTVGDLGTATLFIENGGTVDASSATIGAGAGSSGLVRVRGAGSSLSCTGALDIAPAGVGRLRLINEGTADCGGDLAQHAGGAMEFVIGPGSADMVTVGGTVSLDGAIDVSLSGGYTPAPGSSVTIIEGAVVQGTFSSETLPSGLQLVYEASRVRVVANGGGGDADGDGVPDAEDICPGGDDNVDADGDDVPDFCDPCPLDVNDDTDGDGVCDSSDVCPGGDDTTDSDGDGLPDHCDNCPSIPNGDQADADGDGTGDACECANDVDGNGFVDVDDLVAVILAWGTADPAADVNGDGTVNVDDLVAVILAWGVC